MSLTKEGKAAYWEGRLSLDNDRLYGHERLVKWFDAFAEKYGLRKADILRDATGSARTNQITRLMEVDSDLHGVYQAPIGTYYLTHLIERYMTWYEADCEHENVRFFDGRDGHTLALCKDCGHWRRANSYEIAEYRSKKARMEEHPEGPE